MKPPLNAKINSSLAPDSEDTPSSCLRAVLNMFRIHKRKRARKTENGQRTQDPSPSQEVTNGMPNPTGNSSQRPETRSSSASKPPAQTTAAKESIDTSGEAMANELRNPAAQRLDAKHASTSGQPAQTASAKDTVISNLSAVLDIVQQVGKILQTVPFVEPIGAILSQAVKVYKEVDDNNGKRDALSAKATALDGGIKQAIHWLEKSDNVGNLKTDVDDYTKKLEEVRAVLTVHRGKFSQVIQRGKLAAELALLDQSLNDFSKIFETKCLIRIERGVTRTNHTLADMQQTQGGIARDVADTHQAVLKFVTKTERKEIISWLSPANFFLQQETIFGRRQAGTGEWLLEHDRFKRWETGSGGILWGRGAPGAGKTVLASIVVNHLDKSYADDNIGVACIYLNHKETHAQTTSNLLAGVWQQLVSGKQIASTSLVHQLFQKHSEKGTKPELAQIHELVRLAITEWSRVYIVVDALDETPEDNRQCLLNYLTDMGPNVCLMLTLRHDVSLRNITAETFEIRVPEEDIQKYVEHQINVRLSVTTSSQLRKEIVAKILENVDRMFLLAKLHIESLAACTTVAAIRKRLTKLSSNLELAYSQAMERIEIQAEKRKKLAHSTLAWVTKAMQPLTVTELREALAVEWGTKKLDPEKRPEMKIILSVCAGLVIVDEQGSVVRLVHATTQEYFDGQFPGAHAKITRTLLTYMVFDDLQAILDAKSAIDKWRVELKYTLIRYCHQHCVVHAQNVSQPDRQLRELILVFLERAGAWYRFWQYSWGPCPWNYPNWPYCPSPLWVAAAANLQEIVEHLLDGGISPDSGQIRDDSPLCAASFYGHLHVAELLLERGASVGDDDVLRVASQNGHTELVHSFESGFNPNAVAAPADSALEAASGRGHIDIVRLLLEKGADIQAGHNGALRRASEKGQADVLQFLLEKGANADTGYGENTPLKAASQEGHIHIVRLLFTNGADVHTGNDSALRAASESGYTEVVQVLLRKGANANVTSGNGESLLIATSAGRCMQPSQHVNIVRLLLENGADVNAGNNGALRAASKAGYTKVIQVLLEHGANINAPGDDNVSALEAAACWEGNPSIDKLDSEQKQANKKTEAATRRLELVRFLLDNGADVHGGNNGALRAASKAGHTEVIQLLLKNGANVNAVDEHTSSALEAAASWDGDPSINFRDSEQKKADKQTEATTRRLGLVRLLLDNGANVHAGNNGALRAASKAGHIEVVQLLLKNGANVNAADKHTGSALEAATSWDRYPDPTSQGSEDEERREAARATTHRLTHVRFLLNNGADVHGGNNGALRVASKAGYTEIIQLLLKNGANPNAVDEHTGSALEAAASWDGNPSPTYWDSEERKADKKTEAAMRRLTHVRFLLDNGADVHVGNNGALRAASKRGYTEVMQLLLENGANVNAADEHTGSTLEAAASWDGNPSINSWDSEDVKRREMAEAAARRLTHVRFLLDNGANVYGGNNGALRAASKAGHTEVIQLLLKNGANINAIDDHTGSALEAAACWDGNPDPTHWNLEERRRKMTEAATRRLGLVRLLLDNGADVQARNNGALRAAHERGYTEVEQLLLDHGADALENAETESQNVEPEPQAETDSSEAEAQNAETEK
ncbi:ankyrin repeat-containing domain protein [Mycena rebaudengoi]|nr:ankyrin repeat-containing domain protein [Mycena rebaudengoi]